MKNKFQLLPILFMIIVLSFPTICFSEVKTFIKEYTYHASEDDSRNSSRVTAMREVKRLLLEELGTYLESVTEVKNFQLTKDQITALTAGIVKTEIVNEKWDGHTYWIKTKIVADEGDVIKSIDNLRKDRDKSKELDDLKKRSDAILEENKKLRDELKLAKGSEQQKQINNYEKSINELSSIEWTESGIRNGKKGNNNKALHDFNKAVELNPKNARAYNGRGNIYYINGKYNEAIAEYNRAIELNTKYAGAYKYRGFSYFYLFKYNEAILDFNIAIELDPKDEDAYFGRGLSYYKLDKHRNAIMDFNKSIELNPKDAEVYYNRGNAFFKLRYYYDAIVDFSKAIELNPKHVDAYYERGWAYIMRNQYNDAINNFSKVIELSPKYSQAYFNRACLYSVLDNRKRSIQDLSKAIEINPALRNDAKTDPFFVKIKNTPEFKRLIGK